MVDACSACGRVPARHQARKRRQLAPPAVEDERGTPIETDDEGTFETPSRRRAFSIGRAEGRNPGVTAVVASDSTQDPSA